MGRKTKIQKEIEDKQKELIAILEEEEKDKLRIKDVIQKEVNNKYFCGIYLTLEDIIGILQLYSKTNEPVRVEYRLYSIEENNNGTI